MTWSKSEIQYARKIMLAPVLIKRGYSLRPLEHGNYIVEGQSGKLVIKDCFWFLNDRKISGNAIDFFMTIEKLSFADAMNVLCPRTRTHLSNGV